MQNQPDLKIAFENSILELCNSIGKDEVKKLDFILTREKTEEEIFKDIISAFPQFQNIFSKEISKT